MHTLTYLFLAATSLFCVCGLLVDKRRRVKGRYAFIAQAFPSKELPQPTKLDTFIDSYLDPIMSMATAVLKAILAVVAAVVGIGGIVFLCAVLRGMVLVKLWAWFIVPQFHMAPLRIPFALGLSLLVSMLTNEGDSGQNSNSTASALSLKAKLVIAIKAVSKPLLCLLFGWIYTKFI